MSSVTDSVGTPPMSMIADRRWTLADPQQKPQSQASRLAWTVSKKSLCSLGECSPNPRFIS